MYSQQIISNVLISNTQANLLLSKSIYNPYTPVEDLL